MRSAFTTLLVFSVMTTFCAPALPRPGTAMSQGLIRGQDAHDRVTSLTSLNWHNSLYQAQDQARREGKMIFWVHMLGDIKGDT